MAQGDITRWLYRDHRPHGIARVLNRLWATAAARGFGAGRLVTLEVPGRNTGRPISLPLVPVTVDRQRYVVSMLGDDVAWVRNVRATGGLAVLRHGTREVVRLEEVPVNRRAPVLKAYLQRAPGARPHLPVDRNAPLSAFERIAGGFPVFRVVTGGTDGQADQPLRRS